MQFPDPPLGVSFLLASNQQAQAAADSGVSGVAYHPVSSEWFSGCIEIFSISCRPKLESWLCHGINNKQGEHPLISAIKAVLLAFWNERQLARTIIHHDGESRQ